MIARVVWRSVGTRRGRALPLAVGFALAVAATELLLGVSRALLEQASEPALRSRADLVVTAPGELIGARHFVSSTLAAPPLGERVRAAAPFIERELHLFHAGRSTRVDARGGIPSLERAIGDPETASSASWSDTESDRAWADPDPADVLRRMDGFHPVPDVPHRLSSWGEWHYFNGRLPWGGFYLTLLAGPPSAPGRRAAGVLLRVERGGERQVYAGVFEIDDSALHPDRPDLDIGPNRVRLDGMRYAVRVELRGERPGERARGEFVLSASASGSIPPTQVHGADGWVFGYVVPVLSGALQGHLELDGERLELDGGTGYHDHNWGFWEGVTWRWGQVSTGDLALIYGTVIPPPDAADPRLVPGVLVATGPEGLLGYARDVSIEEHDDPASGRPTRIRVRGSSPALALELDLELEPGMVASPMQRAGPIPADFAARSERWQGEAIGVEYLQLDARYRVTGRIGRRPVELTADGFAETFRPAPR